MKMIEWLKGFWNKKHDNHKEHISNEELKQKKNKFQIRKKAIDGYLSILICRFKHLRDLEDFVVVVLDDIHSAVIKLHDFDKYDLTNPCMTYEEHYNTVIATYRTSIINILDDVPTIPIEILVYYASCSTCLQELLNKCNDLEYQSYCGMFQNDVAILVSDLGFKSMFD